MVNEGNAGFSIAAPLSFRAMAAPDSLLQAIENANIAKRKIDALRFELSAMLDSYSSDSTALSSFPMAIAVSNGYLRAPFANACICSK
jgi:hypothetical protein